MAEITNLNRYRKERKKAEKRGLGALNKVRAGRTKVARLAAKIEAEKRSAELDGKRIERIRPKDSDAE